MTLTLDHAADLDQSLASPRQCADIHDPAFVAGVFDRCAGAYRYWSAVASFGFVGRWRRQCAAALPPPWAKAPVVVDLMAGTGEIWPHVLRRVPGAKRIVAIDISHQMHLNALERLHRGRSDRISHIEADVLAGALPDAMADCAISSFGLKTLSPAQQDTFARELARILKPGATFSLVEATDPRGWWLRPLYRFYLDRVLPLIERLFLNGAQDFSMLGVYTRSFGDCAHLARCLRRHGLEVETRRYVFGCAEGIAGRKPES